MSIVEFPLAKMLPGPTLAAISELNGLVWVHAQWASVSVRRVNGDKVAAETERRHKQRPRSIWNSRDQLWPRNGFHLRESCDGGARWQCTFEGSTIHVPMKFIMAMMSWEEIMRAYILALHPLEQGGA